MNLTKFASNVASKSNPKLRYKKIKFVNTHRNTPSRRLDSVSQAHSLKRKNDMQKIQPTSLSIQKFIDFSKQQDIKSGQSDKSSGKSEIETRSVIFLRRELAIRLANMIKEIESLPPLFKQQNSCQQCLDWFWQSFNDILRFELAEARNKDVHKDFIMCLHNMRNRHSTEPEVMAEAMGEYKFSLDEQTRRTSQALAQADITHLFNKFLNRFFMSRIGLRLLINQHLLLFSKKHREALEKNLDLAGADPEEKALYLHSQLNRIGTFSQNMDINGVIQEAFNDASFLCQQNFIDFSPPKLVLKNEVNMATSSGSNSSSGSTADLFKTCYIEDHLHYICFEIFKNSQRATILQAAKTGLEEPNPITVTVHASDTEFTIVISDLGGGAGREISEKWFDYKYTTADQGVQKESKKEDAGSKAKSSEKENQKQIQTSTMTNVPMAGYGFGLPISKLYAKYLSGGLTIASVEGHGTTAYIYLKRESEEAREVLPNYVDGLGEDYLRMSRGN